MTVYSEQLFVGYISANYTTLYTVPATNTVVLRDLELFAYSGTGLCYISVSNASGSQTGLVSAWTPSSPDESHQWQGRVVVPGGGVIALGNSGNNLTVVLSGYLLS